MSLIRNGFNLKKMTEIRTAMNTSSKCFAFISKHVSNAVLLVLVLSFTSGLLNLTIYL